MGWDMQMEEGGRVVFSVHPTSPFHFLKQGVLKNTCFFLALKNTIFLLL